MSKKRKLRKIIGARTAKVGAASKTGIRRLETKHGRVMEKINKLFR